MKVTFVTVFSCIAIMLGLFSSTGIASAHSTTTLQSQTSASQASHVKRRHKVIQDCRVNFSENVFFVPQRQNWWNSQQNNEWNSWGMQNEQQSLSWSQNSNSFDTSLGDFSHFNRSEENQFNGFFNVKVFEVITCNGHNNGQRSFEWQQV